MIRRIQITLLALFVGVWAMASETSVKNADGVEIWYDFDSNAKTASVTCKGEYYFAFNDEYTGEVVIPSKVTYEGEEYSVTEIGDWAFQSCSSLTTITLPEGVTSIGYFAFGGCSSLTSITISEGLTKIVSWAFQGCSSLTSITIPEGVTEIGESTFENCSSLTSITIPKGVTSIGDNAFYGCSSLTSITLPEGVTSIGNYAFYDCSSLTSITVSEGLTSIGNSTFYNCSSLTSITISEGLTSIGNSAFYNCSSLTSITLPEGVTEIGSSAFYGCSLTSITLPEGVTSIGAKAFYGCRSLASITLPESVTEIGERAFYGCRSFTSITIPESVTSIGSVAFFHCYKLYEVYNKSNLTITAGSSENGGVARFAKNVYTDELGESKLHTAGDYIFYVDEDNIELLAYIGDETAITLPSDYEGKNYKIGNYAFYYCRSLISITIPESVTEIGKNAFDGCSSLTSITIPESVTEIGQSAFSYCSSLTSITIPEGMTEIGGGAFDGCSSLTSITIPEGVTEIGFMAFFGCNGLTSITSMNVTPPSIGDSYTFDGVDKSIPIYVPKQSVEAYKSAEYWKDFTNIVGKFLVVTATAENGTVTGAGVYEENEEVTLIATPDEGYKFVKWEDGETNATRKITVEADATYTATFAINQHTLTVTSNGNGTVSGGGTYDYGTKVTLKATAEDNYHFVKWSDGNTNATREVTVNGDATYTATFIASETSVKNADGVEIWYDFDSSAKTASVTYKGESFSTFSDEYTGEVVIPSKVTYEDEEYSVTKIGEWAFWNCSSLTSITIPEGVTSIGAEAFEGCSSLTSVTIPEGVTSIGNGAFYDCSSLTSITIPEGVTEIGEWAFAECSSLTSITSMNVTPPSIFYSFYRVDKSIPVYVPKQSVEAYKSAEYWEEFTNILGIDDVTPVSDIVADSVSIRLIGNSLIVEGAESYAVYALSGQCLGKVESLERGLYIVVADGVSKRIVVK